MQLFYRLNVDRNSQVLHHHPASGFTFGILPLFLGTMVDYFALYNQERLLSCCNIFFSSFPLIGLCFCIFLLYTAISRKLPRLTAAFIMFFRQYRSLLVISIGEDDMEDFNFHSSRTPMAGMIHGALHIIMYRITGICDYSTHTRKSYRSVALMYLPKTACTNLLSAHSPYKFTSRTLYPDIPPIILKANQLQKTSFCAAKKSGFSRSYFSLMSVFTPAHYAVHIITFVYRSDVVESSTNGFMTSRIASKIPVEFHT
ncbi:hypothetical protein DINM_002114 [Dirofilaria immitis]|nr:hypothetical protein [Dirofilaria immitis]